jgi:hypothetical protein
MADFGLEGNFMTLCGGLFHLVFSSLLWVQTRRVRCVCEKDAFEFYNIRGPHLDFDAGAWLERKPNNFAVSGTLNRWKYNDITTLKFWPSIHFPLICYFTEVGTDPKNRKHMWVTQVLGSSHPDEGQPHFFPGICNALQFQAEMEKHNLKLRK